MGLPRRVEMNTRPNTLPVTGSAQPLAMGRALASREKLLMIDSLL